MISYLSPGDPITAAAWNDIFAAAETILEEALGGLSALFLTDGYYTFSGGYYSVDYNWNRAFFFFDVVTLPSTLHPSATAFLDQAFTSVANGIYSPLYFRQYDHAAITGIIGGLTVASTSTKYGVAVLNPPTWTAWKAAIYPAGFGALSEGSLKQGTGVDPGTGLPINFVPNPNCLDMSLAVIKRTVSGTDYAVTFNDVTMAERPQPFTPIDVFINADLSWDSAWDKYSIIRVHNCAKTTASATFGTVSASLPPGSSKCFRQVSGTWIACGKYLHTMHADDGHLLQMRERGGGGVDFVRIGGAASIFAPGQVADLLAAALNNSNTNFGGKLDPEKFWDMSSVYNNPSHAPAGSYEITPPAGGFFPTPDTSALLGDLIVPRGKFLIANRAVPNTVHATMTIVAAGADFTFTDGDNVVDNISNMAVYDVTTSASIPEEGTPGDPLTTNWAHNYPIKQFTIIPLAGYITAGDVLRVTFDYIPADEHVFVDFTGFADLESQLNSVGVTTRLLTETNPYGGSDLSNLEIYGSLDWHIIDLSTSLVTFLNNRLPGAHIGSSQTSSPPSLKLPILGAFKGTKIADASSTTHYTYYNYTYSGGTYSMGSSVDVVVNNKSATRSVVYNAFLPTDLVSDIFGLMSSTAAADGIISITNERVISTPFGHVLLWDESWPLDAYFASANLNGFDSEPISKIILDTAGLRILVTRMISLENIKYYDRSPAGVFPTTSPTSFLFWNFARVEQGFFDSRFYYHDPADAPLMPAVSGTHWSSQSLSITSFYESTPISEDTIAKVYVRQKKGISRMGAWRRDADIWSPFSFWLNKSGNLTYPTDGAGGTGSINTDPSHYGWYYANGGNVLSDANISQPIPNALPCQVEHINALASVVNAQPPMRLNPSRIGNSGFTLNFAAGNIIILDGGSGHTVDEALNFNLKVASVDGTGKITGVAQNGSVVINSYDAYGTPSRPFALGGDATCDTSVGDGSALTFIPTFYISGVPLGPAAKKPEFAATIRPRGQFFAWHGAASALGADPVGDYLSSLGAAVRTKSDLPYALDGTATVIKPSGLSSYYPDTGYLMSFNTHRYGYVPTDVGTNFGDFNYGSKLLDYCWISASDAKAIYDNFNLPFSLFDTFTPLKLTVSSSTASPAAGDPDSLPVYASSLAAFVFEVDSSSSWQWECEAAGKFHDAIRDPLLSVADNGSIVLNGSFFAGDSSFSESALHVSYVLTFLDLRYPDTSLISGASTSVGVRSCSSVANLFIFIPKNYAEYDSSFDTSAYNQLGSGIIPIIAYNTEESIPSELNMCPASTAILENNYTTSLHNARLVIVPVDGSI